MNDVFLVLAAGAVTLAGAYLQGYWSEKRRAGTESRRAAVAEVNAFLRIAARRYWVESWTEIMDEIYEANTGGIRAIPKDRFKELIRREFETEPGKAQLDQAFGVAMTLSPTDEIATAVIVVQAWAVDKSDQSGARLRDAIQWAQQQVADYVKEGHRQRRFLTGLLNRSHCKQVQTSLR